MKLTEEIQYWNFRLRLFLAEIRLTVLGMYYITQEVLVLLSSTSSRRTSIVDVKLVLTHFDFHLSAIFITLCPNYDILV